MATTQKSSKGEAQGREIEIESEKLARNIRLIKEYLFRACTFSKQALAKKKI